MLRPPVLAAFCTLTLLANATGDSHFLYNGLGSHRIAARVLRAEGELCNNNNFVGAEVGQNAAEQITGAFQSFKMPLFCCDFG